MENNQEEKTFFQDSNVSVTQSRFVASGKTYAMRNISSVTKYKIPKNIKFPIILIIIGAISLAFSAILGGILILAGVLWLVLNKTKYSVRIQSNAGEADSLVSTDEAYVQKIINAVNDAMVHRG